eukprot:CAMPEP_0204073432 /NCGR_PEP_ID=MMETSP0360-20130528/163283_1 /ASSEMBLY_ACC=CAM_ASM_000342 /TAXON_ID=268821 /ORGANISM="Scrippsiella Hangoei, Strain SHTV-5" /LENGTH=57 /DNA_ID=CAMNT_0051021833 /DNA_START=20 /DNA_END=190 /DNA_ORIENTATION=+
MPLASMMPSSLCTPSKRPSLSQPELLWPPRQRRPFDRYSSSHPLCMFKWASAAGFGW